MGGRRRALAAELSPITLYTILLPFFRLIQRGDQCSGTSTSLLAYCQPGDPLGSATQVVHSTPILYISCLSFSGSVDSKGKAKGDTPSGNSLKTGTAVLKRCWSS